MTFRAALIPVGILFMAMAVYVVLSRDEHVEEKITALEETLDLQYQRPDIEPQNNLDQPAHRVASGVVAHRGVEVSEEFLTVAQSLLKRADRYDFIQLDSELLIDRLRHTKAYIYAESGNEPTPQTKEGEVDLVLALLDDYSVRLAITDLTMWNEAGDQGVIIEGRLVGEAPGVFRLSLLGDGTMVRGTFESPERLTRLETWKISTASGVFQYDRATIDEFAVDID